MLNDIPHYDIVIIGSSAAAFGAINVLSDEGSSLLVLSASQHMPYNTCFLVDVIAKAKTSKDIALRVHRQNICFDLNKKIIKLCSEKKLLISSDNSKILYQKLLITTGARPHLPIINNSLDYLTIPGVFTFHTLTDVEVIEQWIHYHTVHRAIIIGGGLTAIECADALHKRGITVTIIEKNQQLLSRHLTALGATFIMEQLRICNVNVLLDTTITQIIGTQTAISAVRLSNGEIIPADMVIIATGTVPNSEFAQAAGLAYNNNYIIVNDTMQTSDEAIFAAGDVVMVKDRITGTLVPSSTWADAVQQGMVAAQAMKGNTVTYPGTFSLITSDFFGLKFAAIGKVDSWQNIQEKKTETEYIGLSCNKEIPFAVQYVGPQLETIADVRRSIVMKKPIGTMRLG